jgi:hypothetical protein
MAVAREPPPIARRKKKVEECSRWLIQRLQCPDFAAVEKHFREFMTWPRLEVRG